MPQLWDRRDPRVGFRAVVRLSGPDQQEPVYANAGNLSQSGLLVDSHRTYDIGSEVVCDLPLPEDHLTVRGRVAWVRTDESVAQAGRSQVEGQGKMGIEFVETPTRGALEQVVGEVGDVEQEVEKVNAWFEGADQPVRVEAVHTEGGLRLRTSIPFFRINSSVAFAYPDDEGEVVMRQGTLRNVDLVLSPDRPVPCLELQVESDPVVLRPGSYTSDDRPVDRIVQLTQDSAHAEPPEAVMVERETFSVPPPLPDAAAGPRDVAGFLHSDRGDAASPSSVQVEEDDELQIDFEVSDEDFEVSARLSDTLNLGVDHEPPAQFEQPDALTAELSAHAHGGLQSYPQVIGAATEDEDLDTGEIDPEFWASAAPQPWRLWIWVAALAMAGIAMASVVQTRLWERVGSAFAGSNEHRAEVAQTTPLEEPAAPPVVVVEPEAPRAQVASAPKPMAVPAPVKEPAGDSVVVEPAAVEAAKPADKSGVKVGGATDETEATASEVAQTPEPVAAASPPAKPAAKQLVLETKTKTRTKTEVSSTWTPRLKRVGDSTTLVIPIRGSIEGLKRYPLGNPDGFVVKLPQARPRVPFGDYRVHDGGFRVVWVREHEQGVQLRFLFSKPTPQHRVEVTERQIRITLTPPPVEPELEEPTDG